MGQGDRGKHHTDVIDAWSATLVEPATARASVEPPPHAHDDPPVSVQPLELSRPMEIIGEIGQGGMGSVVKSLDPRIGRFVAMKSLHPRFAVDGEEVNRFIEEAQVTGQLDHPNIVPVYALSRDEAGRPFFTMKLVQGTTLGEILDEMGERRLEIQNLERLIGILIDVCDAIAFAHSRGVIHRDIKPHNLMVGSFGQVYVMDWGIAALSRSPRLACDTNKLLGTPAFMAPEQVSGHSVTERTDVYGIGGLLYVILTATPPHKGETLNVLLYEMLTHGVEPPTRRRPDIALPPELCRIAEKALALRPEDRHGSVIELREDLVAFRRGGGWLATRHFRTGDAVYHAGDPAEEAFIIIEGECLVIHEEDGEREVLKRVGTGEIFGEVALLSGGIRTTAVEAATELTVKVVTRASLARELEQNAWMKALFDGIALRFRTLEATLREVVDARDE